MKFLILIFSLTLFLACNSNHKKGNTAIENGITLNEGGKWKINEEMIPHIKKAEIEFYRFVETRSTEYGALAKSLHENNAKLIKSCNMDDLAHDELHKWLAPHMELINNLEKAKDEAESMTIIDKLKESFSVFNDYFN